MPRFVYWLFIATKKFASLALKFNVIYNSALDIQAKTVEQRLVSVS